MSEFTGERVIPGLVDADLMNEHVARYRFAARFAEGAAVLDIGCGEGYGSAEMGEASSVTGLDISEEAVSHARANFPAARFVRGTAGKLPFADASFGLVTAFEVIEHLDHWPELLAEAARVLRPEGTLLVSTPNKSYYAEMRSGSGPNPFHRHEFEYAEFEASLYRVFPHVRIWAQNHAAAIVFAPLNPGTAELEAGGDPKPEETHFFVAACGHGGAQAYEGLYAWLPSTGNVLRERERHIARLEAEIAQKDAWLAQMKTDHAALHEAHEKALADVKARSIWAQKATDEVRQRERTILELREELEERLEWVRTVEARSAELENGIALGAAEIARLEAEVDTRTAWARSIEAQLEERTRHVLLQQGEIAHYKTTFAELMRYIEELRGNISDEKQRVAELMAERSLIAKSRWVRLGRAFRLGPVVAAES